MWSSATTPSPTSRPYDDGYNAEGLHYGEQYDPDGDTARAAIWFYGGSNYSIDHNTFLHDYQNIKACQGQQFQAQNILVHHNYSDSHHRMFLEINTGSGCGNPMYNAGIANFQIYDNYDHNAGGAHPAANTFGFSAPFALAIQPGSTVDTPIPMSGVAWYNNLLKGVVNNNQYVGIGLEVGAENMNVYHNTVMAQWPTAGYGFGGTAGGFMQDNYGCILAPSHAGNTYFGDANGKTTVTYRRNRNAGICPPGLASLSISLGAVTNTSGRLTATATVTTVEYGIQGVVFSLDGHYVSAVMGPGPYTLNYGAAALPTGSHSVTATVVDAVGVLVGMRRAKRLHHPRSRTCRPHRSQCRSWATGLRYRRQCGRPDQPAVGAVADHFGQITEVTQNRLCGNYNFSLRRRIFRLSPAIVGLRPTLQIEDLACT